MNNLILYFFSLILISSPLFSQLRPGEFIEYTINTNSQDLLEHDPDYFSYINWSKGTMVTEYYVPITYQDANIGRNIINLSEKLKEKLTEFVLEKITMVRVSSVFFLNDFFKNDKEIQHKVLSIVHNLSIENSMVKNSQFYGRITLPFFGSNSITEYLYKNIRYKEVTNYLQPETASSQFYDTLIIDMVMFPQYKASLMPNIIDHQGNVIHGVETVNPELLKMQGPVHYVTSITEAFNHPIRGKRVAYILPKSPIGTLFSDIILFEQDVKNIFSQKRTLNNLRQGKVIIIVPKEQ